MKKLIYTALMLLVIISCFGQQQMGYKHMSTALWLQDLEYLESKIEKEFMSFDPDVKSTFSREIATAKTKLSEMENHEVAAEIMRLLSLLKDGHTELNIGHNNVGFHRVPLSLYIFEGEFYVLAAHKQYENLVGGKVTAIGDVTIDKAFDRLKANMSRDNAVEYVYAGPGYIILTELLNYLELSDDSVSATFTIEKDGKQVKQRFQGLDIAGYREGNWVSLASQLGTETPLYQTNGGTSYWYKYLEESKTMYFHFRRVNNQKGKPTIRNFTKTLFKEIDELRPEKLVIDLRMNNGGNYHMSKTIVKAIKDRDWLNQPGKVWAITGRRTFSAAATFCVFLKQGTETQLIGEVSRTHPNWADNNEYMTLPNSGFLIEYTTKIKVHWPERPELDHIPVDVEIVPTLEAYRRGIDPVLEYLSKH